MRKFNHIYDSSNPLYMDNKVNTWEVIMKYLEDKESIKSKLPQILDSNDIEIQLNKLLNQLQETTNINTVLELSEQLINLWNKNNSFSEEELLDIELNKSKIKHTVNLDSPTKSSGLSIKDLKDFINSINLDELNSNEKIITLWYKLKKYWERIKSLQDENL